MTVDNRPPPDTPVYRVHDVELRVGELGDVMSLELYSFRSGQSLLREVRHEPPHCHLSCWSLNKAQACSHCLVDRIRSAIEDGHIQWMSNPKTSVGSVGRQELIASVAAICEKKTYTAHIVAAVPGCKCIILRLLPNIQAEGATSAPVQHCQALALESPCMRCQCIRLLPVISNVIRQ